MGSKRSIRSSLEIFKVSLVARQCWGASMPPVFCMEFKYSLTDGGNAFKNF
jgi:hypothetical protein